MIMMMMIMMVAEMKEQRRTDSEVAAETLEEVFQRIQKVTGEDDLEMLVTKFIQGESALSNLHLIYTEMMFQM